MARVRISIDEKIERQKQVVSKAKDKYEAELEILEQLMKKRKDLQNKEIMRAIEKSKKTFDEIVKFLNDGNDE